MEKPLDAGVLRAANLRVFEMRQSASGPRDYQCECGEIACWTTLPIPHDEFARVLTEPGCYVVAPGHHPSDAEIVREGHGHSIVQRVELPA